MLRNSDLDSCYYPGATSAEWCDNSANTQYSVITYMGKNLEKNESMYLNN